MTAWKQNPHLRKIEVTVFRDKSVSDSAQVPADGVSVAVYKRGAISDQTQNLTVGSRTLNLTDSTMLEVDDVLQKGTDGSITATVTALPNAATATVTVAGGTLALVAGDRLVIQGPAGRVPTVYTTTDATITGSMTTDSSGYARGYVKERLCDLIISGGGVTASLRECVTSGDDEMWFSAANFDSIQDAIDAIPLAAGGYCATLHIPRGEYYPDATITVDKPVRIVGDGRYATHIWFKTDKATDVFQITSDNVCIENLSIGYNGSSAAGDGCGIKILPGTYQDDAGDTGGASLGAPTGIPNTVIRNVTIHDSPSWAIKFMGMTDGDPHRGYVSHTLLEKVYITSPRSGGGIYLGSWSYQTQIQSCNINLNNSTSHGYCIQGYNPTALTIINCELAPAGDGPEESIYLDRDDSFGVDCGKDPGDLSVEFGPTGVMILNCGFEQSVATCEQSIYIGYGSGITIMGNYFFTVNNGIKLDTTRDVVCANNLFWMMSDGVQAYDHILHDTINVTILGGSGRDNIQRGSERRTLIQHDGDVGTIILGNGVVQVPSYTTANLPSYDAIWGLAAGALAYDTTTDNLKVLDNSHTWVKVGTQT